MLPALSRIMTSISAAESKGLAATAKLPAKTATMIKNKLIKLIFFIQNRYFFNNNLLIFYKDKIVFANYELDILAEHYKGEKIIYGQVILHGYTFISKNYLYIYYQGELKRFEYTDITSVDIRSNGLIIVSDGKETHVISFKTSKKLQIIPHGAYTLRLSLDDSILYIIDKTEKKIISYKYVL